MSAAAQMEFAMVFTGRTERLKAAAGEAKAAVASVEQTVARTSTAMAAANDQAAASAQRATQALIGQTAAQRQLQQSVEAMIARGSPTDDGTYRQRAADIEAYGQELDSLRAKHVPLFAVQQEHVKTLREIDQALKLGAITGTEHAAAVDGVTMVYNRQVAALTTVGGAARLTSHQLLNLSRQGNDVVTMWALGIPAMQIFVSQAGQVYDALESGPKGLRGSLEAIAVTGRNALSSLLAFATTPAGLATGGAIAAVAGLATYIIATKEDIRSLDDILKDHEGVVKGIADAYGLVQAKAHGAFSFNTRDSFGLSAAANQNELRLALARSVGGDLSSLLIDRGGGASGNQFGPSKIVSSEFAPFADAIDHLRNTARRGQPDILGFKKLVEDRWALDPNNESLTHTAGKLQDMVKDSLDAARALKELDDAKRRFDASVGPGGVPLRRGALSTEDMGSFEQYLAAQRIATERRQKAFDAQQQALYARSPAEIAAAARAAAAAQYNDDEGPQERTQRINLAGQIAQLQAQRQLDEAQKDRKRSLDATLASQQLDLDLIGKTVGQAAQMRLEFQLTQQVREEAARNNVAVDQAELERIKERAAAYGREAELIARRNLAHDLQFERDQLGRSSLDQTIASRLQAAGLKIDLDSREAAEIRMNEVLKQQVDLWKDIRTQGMDAYSDIFDLAFDGFDNWEDRLAKIAKDAAKNLFDLGVKNPFLNQQYDANLPTLDKAGGLGGWIGALLGLTPNPAATAAGVGQSVGAMNVTAAVVNLNGAGGAGGAVDAITNLLSGKGFNPSPTGFMDMLSGRAANDNSAPPLSLSGIGSPLAGASYGGDLASNIRLLASNIGAKPRDLAALMSFESGFNPEIWGGSGGRHFGLIQAGRAERATYGITPGGSLADQFAGIERYFKDRGFKPGMSGLDLYSTVNAGRPGLHNASDAANGGTWGTVADKWNLQMGPHFKRADQLLGKFTDATGSATQGLASTANGLTEFGSGMGQLGKNLANVFPSAPGGGGLSGFGSIFDALRGFFMSPAATMNILSGGGGLYDVGGPTGGSDPRRVAGLVHEKEYVMDAPVVQALGVPFLDSLRRAAKSGRGFMSGGYATPGASSGTGGGGGGGRGGADWSRPVIQITNAHPTATLREEEEDDGEGGRRPNIVVEEQMASGATRRGSAFRKTMEQDYGLRPRVKRL